MSISRWAENEDAVKPPDSERKNSMISSQNVIPLSDRKEMEIEESLLLWRYY